MSPERLTEHTVVQGVGEFQPSPFSITRRRGPWQDALRRRLLALADALAGLAVSAALAFSQADTLAKAFWSAFFVPVWILLAKIHGLYDRDHRALRHLTVDELPSILIWATSGTALLALFLAITPAGGLSTEEALRAWLVVWMVCFVLRALARGAWRRITPRARTLIAGRGLLADAVRRKLELFPDIHIDVIGEVDEVDLGELEQTMNGTQATDRVILASQSIDEDLIADLVTYCRRAHIKLSVIPPARGMFGTAVQLNHVADLPVVEYNTWDVSRSTLLLKRILDVTFSLASIALLAPLFAVIALAIRLDSRGPIFFTQVRAGRGGGCFRMLKFRTMVPDAEELLDDLVPFESLHEPMFKLKDDPRVTNVGRLLRRASLDELPQFLNVLKGDMSLVGPRPEQVELVDRYAPEHLFRLAVKPGLTGPMQVFGRGQLTFEERLAVERDYIENLSLARDIRILALTVSPVFTGKGAF